MKLTIVHQQEEVRMAVATASASTQERPGAVTFKGNPLTLIGPELNVGSKAPDFHLWTDER